MFLDGAKNALGWFWRTTAGKITGGILLFLGIVTAVGKAADAWPRIVESPLRPAFMYDVRVRVAEYKPLVNELLQWKLEDLISRQDERVSKLNEEATTIKGKLPNMNDVQTQVIFENRLKAIEDEKKNVTSQKQKYEKRLQDLGQP